MPQHLSGQMEEKSDETGRRSEMQLKMQLTRARLTDAEVISQACGPTC